MKKILTIILIFICVSASADDKELFKLLNAEGVLVMNNRDYVPTLVELIKSATKSVHAIIYQTGYYPDYPDGEPTYLQDALIEAASRGLQVQLIIDQSSWNPSSSIKNYEYAEYMRSKGVEVYLDPPDITTHTKVVVLDSSTTVVGSTNWSFYALAMNNECAVAVKSLELAKVYENFFSQLMMFKSDTLTIQP
ncbi:MAG: phospholipase D-like domain-containing protein [bacterium]|nr:phospholipase D-like domain-containing protein [bacterium]